MVGTLGDLSVAELERTAEMVAGLRGRGYALRARFNELAAGVRVRHRGHQYGEAYRHGTGVIVMVMERRPSSWSQSWGMPDIEMVVAWDRPAFVDASRLSVVAQYHVVRVAGELE